MVNMDLYDLVANIAETYCKKTYYGHCVAQFEISYDGKEWDKIITLIYFDWPYSGPSIEITFDWDWCEGQHHIRRIKICHLDEIIMPEDCYIYE